MSTTPIPSSTPVAAAGSSPHKGVLSEADIRSLLAEHPDWSLRDGQLVREWLFKDFVSSMAFVNHVAELAEAANHHPDITIHYNRVELSLVSHDAGGITARDARMAKRLSATLPAASTPEL